MLVRAVLSLMIVPAYALVSDAAMDELAGRRLCLDYGVAAESPALTDLLCFTVGADGPARGRDLRLPTSWIDRP